MPTQDEHDKPENLVESPNMKVHPARSLKEAADSNSSLEGFFAMNDVKDVEELEKEAREEPDDETREKGHPVP